MDFPLKYFEIASTLNKKHHFLFNEHDLHLRASKKSLTVVSVNPSTPESGFTCPIKRIANGEFDIALDIFHTRRIKLTPPKRSVVEKELQAWLIRQALKNDNQMFFDKNIKFFTSELANGNSKKVVDILGFNINTKALVIIEIKSERFLERLTEQVNAYEQIIVNDIEFYRQSLDLFGYRWRDNFPIEKIAVWPFANQKKRFPNTIREIQYKKEEKGYSFMEIL